MSNYEIKRIKGGTDNWIRPAKGHLFYDIDVMNKTYRLIHSLGDRTIYYGHGNPTKN